VAIDVGARQYDLAPFKVERDYTSCGLVSPRTHCRHPTSIGDNFVGGHTRAIIRHQNGDWGNVEEEDNQANNAALEQGTRLLSVYRSEAGVTFWVITEADCSSTTVLLPED